MKRMIITSIAFVLGLFCANMFAQESASVNNDAKWDFPAKEDLPRIDELPDPFLKPDGNRVSTPEEWHEQREYLKAMLTHYMYGTVPAAPTNTTGEVLYYRPLYDGKAIAEAVKITFSPDDRPDCKLSFVVDVVRPNIEGKVPVFVYNNQPNAARSDACPEEEEIVCNRHYAIVSFGREQLAKDSAEALTGPLATAYPGYTWGVIAMWSWEVSRVVDYLETTDYADMEKIISTGHSKGGKAALRATIYDDRIALCASNAAGCGGTGCLRFLGSRLGEGYGMVETTGIITSNVPYWWTDEFKNFGTQLPQMSMETVMALGFEEVIKMMPSAADGVTEEYYLPFDLHFAKALVAPRALICTEGLADTWANTYGTQITWIAADEVFQFLGAAGKNALHYREGPHFYRSADWLAAVDFCDQIFFGKEPKSEYMVNPSTTDPGTMKGKSTVFHYSWSRPQVEE